MPLFFRGAGRGTYWHQEDPRLKGFKPRSPEVDASLDRLMNHISKGTVTSPYVSLTRSYGVALAYAMAGKEKPTRKDPAFVWEIELADPLPANVRLLDPVKEIAGKLPEPEQYLSYHHNGPQNVLLGLIEPTMRDLLTQPCPRPLGESGVPNPPRLSDQLQTLVFALRDAEILALGTIPASCVRVRYEVY